MHLEYTLEWSIDGTRNCLPLREGMIGRLPKCCFMVNSTLVRDQHARISLRDGKWRVVAKSGSITQSDGTEVPGLELVPGVEFYFGPVKFVVGERERTARKETHDDGGGRLFSAIPSFTYTEGLRRFFPGKPYYRIGLIGVRGAGKTCYLCALADSHRRGDPDGYTCVWQRMLPEAAEADSADSEVKDAVRQFEEGLKTTEAGLYRLRSGAVPISTSLENIMRYAFLTGAGPSRKPFMIELVDYAGELLEPRTTVEEKVNILRSILRETDGLVILAQYSPGEDGQSHKVEELEVLRTVFQALGEKTNRSDWVRPVCLAVNKWDRKSMVEDKESEISELQQLLFSDEGGSLYRFCHELQTAFGEQNVDIRPMSAFGAAQMKEGFEVPAGGRMSPSMVIDPFIWLRERIDELRVETCARKLANLVVPAAAPGDEKKRSTKFKRGPGGIMPVIRGLGLYPAFSAGAKAEREDRRHHSKLVLSALEYCDPHNQMVKSLVPAINKACSTAHTLADFLNFTRWAVLLIAVIGVVWGIKLVTSQYEGENPLGTKKSEPAETLQPQAGASSGQNGKSPSDSPGNATPTEAVIDKINNANKRLDALKKQMDMPKAETLNEEVKYLEGDDALKKDNRINDAIPKLKSAAKVAEKVQSFIGDSKHKEKYYREIAEENYGNEYIASKIYKMHLNALQEWISQGKVADYNDLSELKEALGICAVKKEWPDSDTYRQFNAYFEDAVQDRIEHDAIRKHESRDELKVIYNSRSNRHMPEVPAESRSFELLMQFVQVAGKDKFYHPYGVEVEIKVFSGSDSFPSTRVNWDTFENGKFKEQKTLSYPLNLKQDQKVEVRILKGELELDYHNIDFSNGIIRPVSIREVLDKKVLPLVFEKPKSGTKVEFRLVIEHDPWQAGKGELPNWKPNLMLLNRY